MRKHYTLYNIYNATRTLLVIAALLIASGGGDVWGQQYVTWPSPVQNNPNNYTLSIPNSEENIGESTIKLFASPGETKTITFQEAGGA